MTFSPGAALLPLRLFLGVTFVYAGVHKLTDPGFLTAGADTYIGTQLEAFAEGTPGGVLLEIATRDQFVTAPAHPYTRALRDAVPEIGRPLAEGTLAS